MRMPTAFSTEQLVTALKASAEPTRLRILLLLAAGELNVKDLTKILGQSQPRISRHLKLLSESGLVERFREGSWVYFHVSDRTEGGRLALQLLEAVDQSESVLRRDRERSESLKAEREAASQDYFRDHAAQWDRIRAMHVAETEVETAMLDALGDRPIRFLVDLGTGTGRVLDLFRDRYERGLGLDVNQAMLAYARSKLAGVPHAQVRHGDIYHLALPDDTADAVVMHQVLHFLSNPALAIREAARVLAPGGRLLIVDFAPHDFEFLRAEHAHERLGFATSHIDQWINEAGLAPVRAHDLVPSGPVATGKLTVSLWLAEKPASADQPGAAATTQSLEETL
jgi:ArsR family transcriptional regulator